VIAASLTRGCVESPDGTETEGRYLEIKLGRLLFLFYIGWGR
jgi:hypothetical protein